jgi:hypothetical protein
MRLKRPRLRRPQVEYLPNHRRHLGWAVIFFLSGLWVWLPVAQASDDLGFKMIAYVAMIINLLIGARLACVRPWFTWE